MSSQILLTRSQGERWFKAEYVPNRTIWAKGHLFDYQGKLWEEQHLPNYFADAVDELGLMAALTRANGCFSVIITTGAVILAAVDRLRSFPLYYAFEENIVLLGDDPGTIKKKLDICEFDSTSADEFAMCGYVIGRNTLYRQIKEIQAGEYVRFAEGQIVPIRYYLHLHGDYYKANEDTHFQALKTISEEIVHRLVLSAGGRPIIVPLSGGYDSRYIVCMLKEIGYQQVICYTYGRADSHEVSISKHVAESLDFQWHFVEYTREKIEWTLREDESWSAFSDYCHQLSSLPHIQDYIALRELIAKGTLPTNGIVVPGFCGDLLGGSYVPVEVQAGSADVLTRIGIVRYLAERHLSLRMFPDDRATSEIVQHIAENVAEYQVTDDSVDAFIGLNEAWFTSHKVAKFVVNSLRVYEFFGLSWRMPLWDQRLIDYWYRVPVAERLNEKLYDRFLFHQYFIPYGVAYRKVTINRSLRLYRVLALLHLPDSLIKKINSVLKKVFHRFQKKTLHFNAFDDFEHFYRSELDQVGLEFFSHAHVNAVYARWYLWHHYGYKRALHPIN